ncbi:putative phospholipid-transporting ATPase IIB [Dictyocoela muelleri]|nr:putative phospholipid-transporting ATPase IIB [Dictyocoela muelleri]
MKTKKELTIRKIKVGQKNRHPKNIICNQKYRWYSFVFIVLISQFKRFTNIYFFSITGSQLFKRYRVTQPFSSIFPLSLVMLLTLIKEGIDDYKRYIRDKIANSEEYTRLKDMKRVPSSELGVGDIIIVEKGQRVPADLVLFKSENGQCFIKTDQLDGETDWKLRVAVPSIQKLSESEILNSEIIICADQPHKDIYSFVGKLSITTKNEIINEPLSLDNMLWMNTKVANEKCLGCVVYTGQDTKAIMNTAKPRNKVGQIEYEIDRYSVILFLISIIVSITFTYLGGGFNNHPDLFIIRFVVIFSAVIPISLRVTIDFVRIYIYKKQIREDKDIAGCIVRSSNMHEELGRISFFLTDKTGTLTKNEMEMKKIHVGTIGYSSELNGEIASIFNRAVMRKNQKKRDLGSRIHDLVQALSLCHNASPIYNEGVRVYQSSSPDEVAILNWTETVGLTLYKRDLNCIVNKDVMGNEHKYTILYTFPFTSENKRMGIIVKKDSTGDIFFFLKGADSVMMPLVKQNDWLEEEIDNMAREGLRTLVIGRKKISENEFRLFSERYMAAQLSVEDRNQEIQRVINDLEKEMDIIGITGVEDKLQDNVIVTLDTLRNAGMKIWMLTGDKIETAISIARSSRLFDKKDHYIVIKDLRSREEGWKIVNKLMESKYDCLVVDGMSIQIFLENFMKDFISVCSEMKAVVCCRCTPTQKALLARYLQQVTKKLVCCIGDGGNDVSMITEANVGVGIVGKEGNQASLAADFSILRFQDVTPLFLWHGRNWYTGTTSLIHFIIHRGTIISVIQGIFSAIFLFNPIAIFQGLIMILYVMIYTILPIFSILSHYPVSKRMTEKYPELYKEMVNKKNLSIKNFMSWNLVSFYQGAVIMVSCLYLFEKKLLSIISITFTSLVINELLMVGFTTLAVTKTMIYADIFGIFFYCLCFILLPNELRIPSPLIPFVFKIFMINSVAILVSVVQLMWQLWACPPSYSKLH